jgi:hypothetical protein
MIKTAKVKITEGHSDIIGKTFTLTWEEKQQAYKVKELPGIYMVDALEDIDLAFEVNMLNQEIQASMFLCGYDELKPAKYIIVKYIKYQ